MNHCRLRHKKEYGSHDECVQNCAVLVEGEEDQVWVVANGTEVAGISLPGLRRLCEMAVGGGDISILPPTTVKVSKPEPESVPDIVQGSGGNAGPPEEAPWPSITPSTEVARTLGVHEDSPALAQLLGRTPKKRCINAYNEDDLVDIFSVDDRLAQKPNHTSWRMSYAPRSKVESWIEESVDHSTEATPTPVSGSPLEENRPPKPNDPPTIPSSTNYGAGSRFHIAARICVEDRSMYIPQGRSPLLHPVLSSHRSP